MTMTIFFNRNYSFYTLYNISESSSVHLMTMVSGVISLYVYFPPFFFFVDSSLWHDLLTCPFSFLDVKYPLNNAYVHFPYLTTKANAKSLRVNFHGLMIDIHRTISLRFHFPFIMTGVYGTISLPVHFPCVVTWYMAQSLYVPIFFALWQGYMAQSL